MKKMNAISIGIKNLTRQKVRTMMIVVFSIVLSASLFVSTILVESMQQSVEKMEDRMGADIIVVPEEYETDYKDALFSGELCTFYMENKWYEPISQIAGVKGIVIAFLFDCASLGEYCRDYPDRICDGVYFKK